MNSASSVLKCFDKWADLKGFEVLLHQMWCLAIIISKDREDLSFFQEQKGSWMQVLHVPLPYESGFKQGIMLGRHANVLPVT